MTKQAHKRGWLGKQYWILPLASGPGALYGSADAAALGWTQHYGKRAATGGVEISSAIYKITYDKQEYYSFTQANELPEKDEQFDHSPGPGDYRPNVIEKCRFVWSDSQVRFVRSSDTRAWKQYTASKFAFFSWK